MPRFKEATRGTSKLKTESNVFPAERLEDRTVTARLSRVAESFGWRPLCLACALLATGAPSSKAAQPSSTATSTWPGEYTVRRDAASGVLTLSTPYYTVQHDLKRGGVISKIQIVHGRASNLLVAPMATRVRDEKGVVFADLKDSKARVFHRRDGLSEVVTVESRLLDEKGQTSGIQVKTVFEYRWGYIKIRKEFISPGQGTPVQEVCPFFTVLAPSLSDYGYREGLTEAEGAPAFSFGSNLWGKLRRENPSDRAVETPYVPRSMILADAGVEGLEWFLGSELSQWDLQLTGRRGQGRCSLTSSQDPAGLALSVSPFFSTNATVPLPKTSTFDFRVGIPMLEGHALAPWFHGSFNRNQGAWVSADQVRQWKDAGIQTVHCHNDGDYYDDGLFWRDGAYPPYPDMTNYDKVIADCHRAGIRVATYFSNKELHPSTGEFQGHGSEWGRHNSKGALQHNLFRGTNEFGAQMCLRSGWLDYLKFSIDRVLKNHPLDGVYYDWNVALLCCNGLHEGRKAGEIGAGHWDIDELLDLMEWTRRRVGPAGVVIVHNTTTPMFSAENFSDYVVANEWGYGTWKEEGPRLEELPLEWSLVGARARGVISYGQLNAQSPKRLHRVFALQALLAGVAPWPASAEAFELASVLKPLGDLRTYRFADWRNQAVLLDGTRCASAIYSRAGESYVLLANMDKNPQEVRCVLHPEKLPYPLPLPVGATLLGGAKAAAQGLESGSGERLDAKELAGQGLKLTLPADGVLLMRLGR